MWLSMLSQGEAAAVSAPAVESQNFAPALLLLAKVLRHTAADLSQGGAHHFPECSLQNELEFETWNP